METFAILGVFLVLIFIAVDVSLVRVLKERDNETYESIGRPGFWGTPNKYKFWYSFVLLGSYKQAELSEESKKLCFANQVLLGVLHMFVLVWFVLVGIVN